MFRFITFPFRFVISRFNYKSCFKKEVRSVATIKMKHHFSKDATLNDFQEFVNKRDVEFLRILPLEDGSYEVEYKPVKEEDY